MGIQGKQVGVERYTNFLARSYEHQYCIFCWLPHSKHVVNNKKDKLLPDKPKSLCRVNGYLFPLNARVRLL